MNQVAKKLENNIQVSAVFPKDIYLIWKYINKFLERSCKRSNGRHTIDTIYKQLIDNEVHLWIAFDAEEDLIKGCVVTNFVYYPTGLKMLNILQLGGKNMEDWMEVVRPKITQWAKQNKCEGIEATGRKGVSHWLTKKDNNWKEDNIHFELKFEEKI
jgi:hypothetical protein|tara:strand:+ start:70 stop:540 length:471 start_codon:yes stop_codon:yes gene_type:complete